MKTVHLLLTSFVLFGCAQDKSLIQVNNQSPEISILFESVDHVLSEGNEVAFTALVNDNNEDASSLQVQWRSDDRVLCDWSQADVDGLNTCLFYPGVTDTILTAIVKDSREAKSTAEVELFVEPNQPPEITVLEPFQNWNYYSSHPVPLHLEVSDDWNDPSTVELMLISSVDGALNDSWMITSDGAVRGDLVLSEGSHAIMIQATDLIGAATVENVIFVVDGPNTPPECQLTDATTLFQTNTLSEIIGSAVDINIPSEHLSAKWTSDLDGDLGENSVSQTGEAHLNTLLSPGTHLITLTVSDEVGDTCEASNNYFVNSKPSISIQEWSSSVVQGPFSLSNFLSYDYRVDDQTDNVDLVTVSAYSDIDGEVSQSSPNQSGDGVVEFSNLSAGVHTITLTATDPHGSTDTITTKIHINTPPSIVGPYFAVALSNTDLEFIGVPDDQDGDPVTVSYTWTQNGQPTGFTTNIVPKGSITEGDLWTVNAVPNDGFVDGTAVSQTLVVQNAPPSIQHHEILPQTIFNDSNH